jgi:hypothetical protein
VQQNRVRVELYIRQPRLPGKYSFNRLHNEKDNIENEFGVALDWQELPDRDASRIAIHLNDANVSDESDWFRQHGWMFNQISRFREVFSNRIRVLNAARPHMDGEGIDADVEEENFEY